MTDKEVITAIINCIWRKDVCGVWICSGDIVPCEKNMADGKCKTLIELVQAEARGENK